MQKVGTRTHDDSDDSDDFKGTKVIFFNNKPLLPSSAKSVLGTAYGGNGRS